MGKIIKNADDCHDKELVKREHHLTRFVVCNAPMMPRKTLIKYYKLTHTVIFIIELYGVNVLYS